MTIKESVYKIISRNHTHSLDSIKGLIKSLHESFSSDDLISIKQTELDSLIKKTLDLLEKTNTQLSLLLDEYTNVDSAKISDDTRILEKSRIERKIQSTEEVKQKILNNIISLKEQKDKMFLLIDQIEFDTSIFVNCIIKRMKEFDQMKN
jgi:hypothetical protein